MACSSDSIVETNLCLVYRSLGHLVSDVPGEAKGRGATPGAMPMEHAADISFCAAGKCPNSIKITTSHIITNIWLAVVGDCRQCDVTI